MTPDITALVEGLEEPLLSDAFEERRITDGALAERLAKERRSAATALRTALARIEELEGENRQLSARNAEISMLAHRWMVAHDMRQAGKPYDFPEPADLPKSEARALAAEAQVKRLVEALKPFAMAGDHFDSYGHNKVSPPSDDKVFFGWPDHDVTIGHFRRARSALLSVGEKANE